MMEHPIHIVKYQDSWILIMEAHDSYAYYGKFQSWDDNIDDWWMMEIPSCDDPSFKTDEQPMLFASEEHAKAFLMADRL